MSLNHTQDYSRLGMDISITVAPHELRNNDLTFRELLEESSATGHILKANDPWRDSYSNLHYNFLNSVQSHASQLQIFDIIADFIQGCSDTLELVRG